MHLYIGAYTQTKIVCRLLPIGEFLFTAFKDKTRFSKEKHQERRISQKSLKFVRCNRRFWLKLVVQCARA